ncbi:hypothetical protein GCM10022393_02160 [Aquimarina addita]|uniref:Uncharacterized protein n=1 Tax=Aquimarina addita TaxID=870485 RepID=A0ABP7X8C7_9FLAO
MKYLLSIILMPVLGLLLILSRDHNVPSADSSHIFIKKIKIEENITADLQVDKGWIPLIVDEQLEIPKIGPDDWSYPWYMIKHNDGHFENITEDTIIEKDTIRVIHHSKCYTYLTKKGKTIPISRIPFVTSEIKGDTLALTLFDESASNNEKLTLQLVNDFFKINYHTVYVFPYKDIQYEFKSASLKVNKMPPYKKGMLLKGVLATEFVETIIYNDNTPSDVRDKLIEGTFEYKLK